MDSDVRRPLYLEGQWHSHPADSLTPPHDICKSPSNLEVLSRRSCGLSSARLHGSRHRAQRQVYSIHTLHNLLCPCITTLRVALKRNLRQGAHADLAQCAHMAVGTERSALLEGRLAWLSRGAFQMDSLSRCASTSGSPSSVCGLAPDSACR